MRVFVQSKSVPITGALKKFVENHVGRMVKRGIRILTVTVSLEQIARKKSDQSASAAQVCVTVPGKTLVVKRHAQDLYLAIQDAIERSDRQLRKMKERRLKNKRVKVNTPPGWSIQPV